MVVEFIIKEEYGGGGNTGMDMESNVIEFVTIATTSNATDFGDLTVARRHGGGFQNQTRGLFGGGGDIIQVTHNVIDFVTIASTGNATDFGDLTDAKEELCNKKWITNKRLLLVVDIDYGEVTNIIDFITIATTGNAQQILVI